MAFDMAWGLVSKVVDKSLFLVARHVGYVIMSESYVKDLQDRIDNITDDRVQLQHKIDDAQRTEEDRIEQKVIRWSQKADALKDEAEKLIEYRKDVAHCYGCVANPKTRYQLGRKAAHKLLEIRDHLNENNFEKISYRSSEPESITASSSQGGVILQSRERVLSDIMKALKDDTVERIGVYGVGGVGKTTLLHQVQSQAKASKEFDEVLLQVVSQNPILKEIKRNIAYAFDQVKLKADKDDKEKGHANGPSTKKVVLVILDDLWKQLDLEGIGIQQREGIKVKVLMSSRFHNVLADEMDCRQTIHLELLKEEDSWNLLAHMLGDKVQDTNLEGTAREVSKKCHGSPLLIDALAKVLKKSDSPKEWEDALEQLKESDSVQKSLELSFKYLEKRQIVLLSIISALDGRGGISGETLLRYGVGIGLFQCAGINNIVKTSRSDNRALLNGLQAASLLLDCDDGCVMLHDVVREAVISTAAQGQHNLVLQNEKDLKDSYVKLRESRTIFLPRPDIQELPCVWECPELEMLIVLGEEDHLLQIPDFFLAFMPKLKVLGFARACARPLPSSIQYLKNLQTLSLDYCDMEDARIIGELKTLQILSFTGCGITRLPKEIGELTELRLLDLSHCWKLEVIEPGTLERLVRLEELYMEDSFVQWHSERDVEQRNASLAELNKMTDLSNLDIVVPEVGMLHKDLPFGKLAQCRIHIGDVWDWFGEYKGQRTLKVKLESDDILSEDWFQLTMQRTEHLHLHGLDGIIRSIDELCREGFQELKHLHVENCISINYVIHSTTFIVETAFHVLESIFLEMLPNLERICRGLPRKDCLERLQVLIVKHCRKLKNLFSLSLLRHLRNLEKIEVTDCNMMQEIVIAERMEEEAKKIEVTMNNPAKKKKIAKDKVELRRLRHIILENLPEISSFFINAEPIPSHSKMNKEHDSTEDKCRNGDAFFNSHQVSLPFLESVELSKLPNLVKAIGSNVVTKLENLESLSIRECQSMEEVFNFQGLDVASGNVEILPKLYKLMLTDLPILRRLWSKIPRRIKGFQNLRSLEVEACSSLRYMFTSSMAKALVNLQRLEVSSCYKMEAIVMEERTWFQSLKVLAKATKCPSHTILSSSCSREDFMEGSAKIEEVDENDEDTSDDIRGYFPSLKALKIQWCNKIKGFVLSCKRKGEAMMVNETDTTIFFNPKVHLPLLEELSLRGVGGIEKIWHDDKPPQKKKSFCELQSLEIWYCSRLSAVIPSTLTERLKSLKSVRVELCESVERVFGVPAAAASWRDESNEKLIKWVILPKLKQVNLGNLPLLTHVVEMSGSQSQSQSQSQCHRVLLAFPNLTKVEVFGCERLENLFHATTATTLSKLEEVSIDYCSGMKEVITKLEEEGEVGERIDKMTFPRLSSVTLIKLPSLICFSSAVSRSFYFPSLEILKISSCDQMEAFISIVAHTAFFNQMVKLPKLGKLETDHIGILKELLWHAQIPPADIPSFTRRRRLRRLETLCIDLTKSHRTTVLENVSSLSSFLISHRSLTCLEFKGCQQLRNLFTTSQLKCLQQLHRLIIDTCKDMEHVVVVAPDQATDGPATGGGNIGIVFPCLTSLELRGMSKLSGFYRDEDEKEGHTSSSRGKGKQSREDFTLGRNDEDNLQPSLFRVEQVSFPRLERLVISGIDKLRTIWHGEVPPGAFSKVTEITVASCNKLVNLFTFDTFRAFINLEKLSILKCDALSVIYDLQDFMISETAEAITTQLKELKLHGLKKLEHIWRRNRDPKGGILISYQNLCTVHAQGCKSLSYVFPASIIESLGKLEELKIGKCGIKVVVCAEDGEDRVSDDRKVVFPQLAHLKIGGLSELKSFHSAGRISKFPLLRELEIEGGGCFELFSSNSDMATTSFKWTSASASQHVEKASPIHQQEQPLFLVDKVSFPCLEKFTISDMKNLVTLFPPKTVLTFWKLEELNINKCNKLGVIYDMRGDGLIDEDMDSDDVLSTPKFVFPRLKRLLLGELEELKSFFRIPHICIWPLLEEITIEKCHSIQNLFQNEACMDSVPQQIGLFLVDKVSFPRLKKFTISDMKNLVTLFPPSTVLTFRKLEELTISKCNKLGVIYDKHGNGLMDEDMDTNYVLGNPKCVFPCLKRLLLRELEELKSFYQIPHICKWPLLEELHIEKCHRIQNLFYKFDKFQNDACMNSPLQQIGLFLVDKVPFFPCLKRLKISHMDNLRTIWNSSVDVGSICELREISVKGCPALVTLFSPNIVRALENLGKLKVKGCSSLEVIYDMEDAGPEVPAGGLVTKLRKLNLEDLAKLKHICRRDPRAGIPISFQNLCFIGVRGCRSLEYLFHASVAKTLFQLVWLLVINCGLEVIVMKDDQGGLEVGDTPKFVFPQATSLYLLGLPQLKSFYTGPYVSRWPLLREFMISDCNIEELFALDNSKTIPRAVTRNISSPDQQPLFLVDKATFPELEELHLHRNDKMKQIWSGKQTCFRMGYFPQLDKLGELSVMNCDRVVDILLPPSPSFMNLTCLIVSKCHGSKALLTLPAAKNLVQLTKLIIAECDSLIEVVANGGHTNKSALVFAKLAHLRLERLLSITHFARDCALIFPSLEEVIVNSCPVLEVFSHGDVSTPKLQKVQIKSEGEVRGKIEHCLPMDEDEEEDDDDDNEEEEEEEERGEVVGRGGEQDDVDDNYNNDENDGEQQHHQHDDGGDDGDYRRVDDLNRTIKRMFTYKVGLSKLEYLRLSKSLHKWKEIWLNHHPPDFFILLKRLIVEDCGFLSTVITSVKLPILNNLEFLEVKDCGAVEKVFDSPQETVAAGLASSTIRDSALATLYLTNLPALRLIIPDDVQRVFRFTKLATLKIENCNALRSILSPKMALELPQLKKIEITGCQLLEEVILCEKETPEQIRFEKLQRITLESLPTLVGFFPGSCFLNCPSLLTITIKNCPKMNSFTSPPLTTGTYEMDHDDEGGDKRTCPKKWGNVIHIPNEPFFTEKVLFPSLRKLVLSHMDSISIIWHDHLAKKSFCKLRGIEIEHCAKLLKVFPPVSIKRFRRLRKLSIADCDSLEEVFDPSETGEEGGGGGEIIMRLKEVTLSRLLKLRSIWKWVELEGMTSFKDLKPVLRANECPNLENISGFSVCY